MTSRDLLEKCMIACGPISLGVATVALVFSMKCCGGCDNQNGGVNTKVVQVEARVASLEEDVTTLNRQYESLDKRVSANANAIKNNTSSISNNAENIRKNTQSINEIKGKIGNINITQIQNDINGIKTRVDALEKKPEKKADCTTTVRMIVGGYTR